MEPGPYEKGEGDFRTPKCGTHSQVEVVRILKPDPNFRSRHYIRTPTINSTKIEHHSRRSKVIFQIGNTFDRLRSGKQFTGSSRANRAFQTDPSPRPDASSSTGEPPVFGLSLRYSADASGLSHDDFLPKLLANDSSDAGISTRAAFAATQRRPHWLVCSTSEEAAFRITDGAESVAPRRILIADFLERLNFK